MSRKRKNWKGKDQCIHGERRGHIPKWEAIGETKFVPNPVFFGLIKTYWPSSFFRCCGKAMQRVRELQLMRCEICGKETYFITGALNKARCSCCGRVEIGFENYD